jgi:hypothetical protein
MSATISIVILLLHCYFVCYRAFEAWQLTRPWMDKLLQSLSRSEWLNESFLCKFISIAFASLTRLGVTTASRSVSNRKTIFWTVVGVSFYFGSPLIFRMDWRIDSLGVAYILVTALGWAMLYQVMIWMISRFAIMIGKDIFNRFNESFPQEEHLLTNSSSVNIRARYRFRNHIRDSWLNLREPYKGTIIVGNPGGGKTRFFFTPILNQLIEQNFTGLVFDFKFPDLSRVAYHALKKHQGKLEKPPAFYVVNFDDLSRTHRCNPLDPASMHDISDALESAKIILLAINREWIRRQGDFFVESAISFITANIWFLRKFDDGKYCTLPHLIELIQSDYSKLFSVLRSFPEIYTLIQVFVSAFLSDTLDQLEGQVASARIALSSLASPNLYYVLSGSDFTLDINNPNDPKLVCMGSSPQKQMLYGAVLSLYISRTMKIINKTGQRPCFLVMDEFPQVYYPSIDSTLATGRQHLIAPFLGIQSIDQVRKEYGREMADVIFNLPGNIFATISNGDTAKLVSERIGKILQTKTSYSINSRDSSTSQSENLDYAIPPSKISMLSSGEFVGILADSPTEKLTLKAFHCEVQPDTAWEKEYAEHSENIPVIRQMGKNEVDDNFNQIKSDIQRILSRQMERMAKSPVMSKLIINKPGSSQ